MKPNKFVSDIVSPFYLHEVTSATESVRGVLFKLNITSPDLNEFIPHEEVDILKVSRIKDALLSGELDSLPIIVGVIDDDFVDILREVDLSNVEMDKISTIAVNNSISKENNLLLIDGHHRYTAAKRAMKSGIPVSLWCWLVPFNKLQVYSFIKTFTWHSQIKINQLVNFKYKILLENPSDANIDILTIVLFLNGYFYQFTADSEKEFLYEMENLKSKLEENQLILVGKQEVLDNDNRFITPNEQENHLTLWHTLITHDMVLKVVKQGRVLPLHSTCFKPKPKCVPGALLELNLDEGFLFFTQA